MADDSETTACVSPNGKSDTQAGLTITGKQQTTELPAFLKRVHRHPRLVVERTEGDRTVVWETCDREISLHGVFTADELRQMADMMENLQ